MSIEATCGTCERRFDLTMIGPDADSPGRCPFCGTRFGRHYTTVLVEAIDDAESSSQRLVAALGRLQGMETGFDIDVESALDDMSTQVKDREREKAAG